MHDLCQPAPQSEGRRIDVVFVFAEAGVFRDKGSIDLLFGEDIVERQVFSLQECVLQQRKALGANACRVVG